MTDEDQLSPHIRGDAVEIRSSGGFTETLQRLSDEIAARGLTIFGRFDHAANAQAVGLRMPPTTVLVFGNARGGTPLMLRSPGLALDLPLRMLVRQAGRDVVVSYHDPAAVLAAHGLRASEATALAVVATIARDVARA
jgi:uncharacterized protein (DUF302 family)